MTYKRILVLIALFALLPMGAARAEAPVLVLFDGSDMPSACALTEALVYMGLEYRLVDPSKAKDISGYSRAIVLVDPRTARTDDFSNLLMASGIPLFVIGAGGIDALTDARLIKGNLSVEYSFLSGVSRSWLTERTQVSVLSQWSEAYGGSIGLMEGEKYPLCAREGDITHLAWFDPADEAMRAALPDLLARWMWPYENRPTQYGTYLVLEEVYPFEDLSLLRAAGEALSNRGVPYAIEAMPVSVNADYPAMKRFCEVLAYLQAKGAAVVLRVPLNGLDALDEAEGKEAIRVAYEAYARYGVYPLALSAPADYLWDDDGLAALRGSKTIFLHPAETAAATENKAYLDGHLLIASAAGQAEPLTDVYATAVYVSLEGGVEAVMARVDDLGGAPVKSLWEIDNALYIGDHGFFNAGYEITYDHQNETIAYLPFSYEPYEYDRGFVRSLTAQIEANNRVLFVLVVSASMILTGLIVMARRQMRRQLLTHPDRSGRGRKP